MTVRKFRRPLSFDSLESISLLSVPGLAETHAAVHHHLAQVHRAPKPPVGNVALNLSGIVQGTYRVTGHGSAAVFSGKGNIDSIGRGQARGTLSFGEASSGQFTLTFGKRGKLVTGVSGLTPAGQYTVQITGGTKTFAGDTGGGIATVQIVSSNAAQTRGRFVLNLTSATTT